MIVVKELMLNLGIIILVSIFSMLLSDLKDAMTKKHSYTHYDGIGELSSSKDSDKCISIANIVVLCFYLAMMLSVFLYVYVYSILCCKCCQLR